MNRATRYLPILAACFLLTGCYKDEVDLATLNNNPFDPEYQGPAVFASEGTWQVVIQAGGNSVVMQDIGFRVNEDLFLAPATYSVAVKDLYSGIGSEAAPTSEPGRWIYRRGPLPGQEVCIELRLMNSTSTARPETICVTL